MRQYLDLTTWILLFAMAPFTILVLLSQNTIPGDLFYPVKRGMENVILTAASVNPGTKVAFRTDLTERRFTEAQKLLAIRADTTAFTDFVSEVSSTQGDISNFSNQQEKIESSEKLIAEIKEYQGQLVQVQNQIQIAQDPSFASAPQNIAIQITPAPVQTSQDQTSFVPAQTQAPIPQATNQPIQTTSPTLQPLPSGQATQPTLTPVQNIAQPTPLPSLTPAVIAEIASNPQKAEKEKQKLKKNIENLEKIKEKLEEQKEDAEFREKVREEQQKEKEESKRRGENGSGNVR